MNYDVLPRIIVYYNKWHTFENKEIRDMFKKLSLSEVAGLKTGTEIFRDDEPYHNGKVYGFKKEIISDIIKQGDSVKVYFSGTDFLTMKDGDARIFKVEDVSKLKSLIDNNLDADYEHM